MYIILFIIIIHFIFFQNKMLTFMNTNSKSSSHVFSQFLNYFNFIPWYNFVVLKAGVKTVNYVFIYHYFVTLKWVHWLITKVWKCVWCVFIYYFQLIKITNSVQCCSTCVTSLCSWHSGQHVQKCIKSLYRGNVFIYCKWIHIIKE